MGQSMGQDDVAARLSRLNEQQLLGVLEYIESLQGDDTALAVIAELRRKEAPLGALTVARTAIEKWAAAAPPLAGKKDGDSAEDNPLAQARKLYAIELDDIIRRVAAD